MPEVIKTKRQICGGDAVRIPDAEISCRLALVPQETEGERAAPPEPQICRTIIKEVFRDPEPLSRAELALLYRDELMQLRGEAERQGYESALAQSQARLDECIYRAQQLESELRAEQEQYMNRYCAQLSGFAVEIAEKMIRQKIREDDLILRELVLETVERMKNTPWLRVELSEELGELVEFMKTELAKPDYSGRATVCASSCAADTCRVVTEEGAAVATISVQADNLRAAFAKAGEAD